MNKINLKYKIVNSKNEPALIKIVEKAHVIINGKRLTDLTTYYKTLWLDKKITNETRILFETEEEKGDYEVSVWVNKKKAPITFKGAFDFSMDDVELIVNEIQELNLIINCK